MNACSCNKEAFEPRESIWTVIEENSLEEERAEMKTMIGRSLIEETQELHEEVGTLLEIWRNYRGETDRMSQCNYLTDPPHVRENLVRQIKMFIKLFQEKTSKYERNISRILSPSQTAIVDKISKENDESSNFVERPATALSYADRGQTPLRPSSSSSSGRASSAGSRLSDYFQTIEKHKDFDEIERLADIIREEIEQERIGLCDDITFLQQCLMDESSYRQAVTCVTQEPSLKDLQDIGLKLEKELLKKENPLVKRDVKTVPSKAMAETRIKNNSSKSFHEVDRKLIPSPPSSAPTTKVRNHLNHRRQIIAKTFSFPSESSKKSDENEDAFQHVHKSSICTKSTATTTVPVSLVTVTAGSNSTRLRNMVLECRDQS